MHEGVREMLNLIPEGWPFRIVQIQGRTHQGAYVILVERVLISKEQFFGTYMWPSVGNTANSGGKECLSPQ